MSGHENPTDLAFTAIVLDPGSPSGVGRLRLVTEAGMRPELGAVKTGSRLRSPLPSPRPAP